MKFNVTWPDGSTTEETSETTSPDAYAMERWGASSADAAMQAYGVAIVAIEDDAAIVAIEDDAPEHE